MHPVIDRYRTQEEEQPLWVLLDDPPRRHTGAAGIRNRKAGVSGVAASFGNRKTGVFSVAGNVAGWVAYVGEDALPDLDGDPDYFSATLPFSIPTTPPGVGTKTYFVVVRYRNEYGLESLNQKAYSFTIDTTGTLLLPVIPIPVAVLVSVEKGQMLRVGAAYPAKDLEEYPATTWRFWASTSAIDTDTDPPTAEQAVRGALMRPMLVGGFPAGTYNLALALYRDTDSGQSSPWTGTIVIPDVPSPPTAP